MRVWMIIFSLFISSSIWAKQRLDVLAASPCVRGTQLASHNLTEHYQQGIFTLYYTTVGEDALDDSTRRISSDPPQRILDIGQQLKAAQQFYTQDLHLRSPLNQRIFQNAKQINVFILDLKGHGRAFDKVAHETFAKGQTVPCGLKIMLSNRLDPRSNPTPAHELFHLYQYGYAVFKQRWYLEGMAKWMEAVFKSETTASVAMMSTSNCQTWYPQSYNAAIFWQSIASQDSEIQVTVTPLYYSNQQPVFKKNSFIGGSRVAPFFDALSQQSLFLEKKRHKPMKDWSEAEQHQEQDNDQICQAASQLSK